MIRGSARLLLRVVFGLASLCIALVVALAAGLVFAIGTQAGNDFLRDRTEVLIGQLIGSGDAVDVGGQSVSISSSGNLVLRWADVRLVPSSGDAVHSVRQMDAELRPWPLLSGRVELQSLALEGVEMDVAALADWTSVPPAGVSSDTRLSVAGLADMGLDIAEQALRQLQGLPLRTVRLADVSLTGLRAGEVSLPPLRIVTAELQRADETGFTLASRLAMGRIAAPLNGTVRFDTEAGTPASLHLESMGLALREMFALGGDGGAGPIHADAGLAVTAVFGESPGERRAEVALTLGAGTAQIGDDMVGLQGAVLRGSVGPDSDALILEPSEVALDGFKARIAGRVAPETIGSGTGLPRRFHFSLESAGMTSLAGRRNGDAVEGAFRLAGSLDLNDRRLVLSDVAISTGGGSLSGTGAFAYGSPDAQTFLRLTAADLPVPSVKAFWPFLLASDTREWVLENFGQSGVVWAGSINLDLTYHRLQRVLADAEEDLRAEEFRLDAVLEDAGFRTWGGLPGLWRTAGRVEARGGETIVFVDSAEVSGAPLVAVRPSSIRFAERPGGETQADLLLNLGGSAAGLLAIAEREPVRALDGLDLSPADIGGQAEAKVEASLLLGKDVTGDRLLRWLVEATLDDAAIAKPIEGRMLSALDGSLWVEPGQASGTVTGLLDELPATINFVRPFGSAPAVTESLTVELSLSDGDLAKAAPALDAVVAGKVDAKIIRDGEGTRAQVDLGAATLTVPGISWTKGAGVPATLSFNMTDIEDGTRLSEVSLAGAGFAASGEVDLGPDGLRRARIDRLALNRGDEVSLDIERVSNGYSLRADGGKFDARPFLRSIRASLASGGEDTGRLPDSQLDVSVSLDEVTGFGREAIRDLVLNYAGSGSDIAALSLQATTAEGETLSVDVSPRGSERSVTVAARDMGALLRFSDLYHRMEGGRGSLTLEGARGAAYDGRLVLRDFTLVDEPRLSSLVGAQPSSDRPSLSEALGPGVTTERAFFDQAVAEVSYDSASLMVENGILRGPIFGSSFEGTIYDSRERIDISGSFMPAYGINRLFGAIPIFGQILGNGNEGGLIGITYRLSGAFSAPTLTVNPISAIAPGMFRQIFAYQ